MADYVFVMTRRRILGIHDANYKYMMARMSFAQDIETAIYMLLLWGTHFVGRIVVKVDPV